MGNGSEYTLPKRRYIVSTRKMLTIINHQENASENHLHPLGWQE